MKKWQATSLARLDVRGSLDGVEAGIEALGTLAARGVVVLNPPSALLIAHDKLLTARTVGEARIAHPATYLQLPDEEVMDVSLPVVVKPRFGSWGRDVVLCRNRAELTRTRHSADPSGAARALRSQPPLPPAPISLESTSCRSTAGGP